MDTLSEDLRALVLQRIDTETSHWVEQTESSGEEGLDKIVNLFDDDADLERFTRSVQSDVVAGGGVQWENGRSALFLLVPSVDPEVKSAFWCRTDNGDRVVTTPPNAILTHKKRNDGQIPTHPCNKVYMGYRRNISSCWLRHKRDGYCWIKCSHAHWNLTQFFILVLQVECSSKVLTRMMPHTVAMESSRRNMLQPPFEFYLRPRITNPCRPYSNPKADFDSRIFSASLFSIFQLWIRFETRSFRRSFLIGSGPIVKEAPPLVETRAPKGSFKFFINHHLTKRLLERWSWQMTTGLKCKDWWLANLGFLADNQLVFCVKVLVESRGRRVRVWKRGYATDKDAQLRALLRRISQNYLFRALHWRRAIANMWE